jgi:hypothetical protein
MHKKKMKSLMSDKDNKDSNVMELKGQKYIISKLGSQVDIYAATTQAMGAMFAAPTLDGSTTKQDEMKWSKDYDAYIKKKTKKW